MASVPLEDSLHTCDDVEHREVYSSIGEFAMQCVRENQRVIDEHDNWYRLKADEKLKEPGLTRYQRIKIHAKGIFREVMGGLGKALCYSIPVNCYLLSPIVFKKQYVLRH